MVASSLLSIPLGLIRGTVWVTFHADPALGFPGMQAKIEELKKELPNVHVLDQFTNQANPEAHMRWTGMVTRSV